MDRRTRIAVVGAGLGGMTVTGFLPRAGFDATIYEQAPSFSRIGAGIILTSNATKVLRTLGVEQKLVDTGIKADCYISRAWDSGKTIYEIWFDAESEAKYGGPYVNIHRGDLHAVIETAVRPGSIAFNHRLVELKETANAVQLRFDNGVTVEADIVIGADGVNSRVREHLIGPEPPRFIGMAAHRAIFPAELLDGYEIPDCTKWWGGDRHLLVYYMTNRRDEVYVIGVRPWKSWDSATVPLPSSREALLEAFGHFHPDLHRVLNVVRDVSLWPIFDRARNDRWSGGRVVLLGDSCHPVPPFMAAGGAMAIEDAAILSRCLVEFDTPAKAFRSYEATRQTRVGDVQRISWENTWMGGPTDTDWFYCYDACAAPLAAAPARQRATSQ